MATVIDATRNLVKLDNGQTITAQTGGWYDAQQYWGGTLSMPGQINAQSNQPGAGHDVNPEVIKATNPAQGLAPGTNEAYIASQRAKYAQTSGSQTTSPSFTNTTGGVTTSGTGTTGGGITGLNEAFSATPSINLPNIYQTLYTSSGIDEKNKRLTDLESKYLQARNNISDNPFLSASMVDQRLQRLQRKYELETAPIKNEIATAKADIETQLNLQTKQFDINSEQAKNALSYFNTLLEAGALDNATGEDIASITRATGLSSSIIQSAVNANKAKNVKTQVETFTADDGTVTAVTIDANTGKVISQTSLGQIGNQQLAGSKLTESEKSQAYKDQAITDAQSGVTLSDLIQIYSSVMDIKDIYQIYLLHNIYGTPSASSTPGNVVEALKNAGIYVPD